MHQAGPVAIQLSTRPGGGAGGSTHHQSLASLRPSALHHHLQEVPPPPTHPRQHLLQLVQQVLEVVAGVAVRLGKGVGIQPQDYRPPDLVLRVLAAPVGARPCGSSAAQASQGPALSQDDDDS